MIIERYAIFVFVFLIWSTALGQPNTDLEQALLNQGIRIETFDFARDKEDVFELGALEWTPMHWTETVRLNAWERYWFRFKVTNTSAETFECILTMPHAHWIKILVYAPGGINKLKEYEAGSFVDFEKRPFSLLSRAVPIVISGFEQQIILVGLKTYENPKIDSLNWIIESKEAIRTDLYERQFNYYVPSGYYIAVFLIIAMIFTILFFITRDKAVGWYALYVWSIFLFYFRKYEIRPGEPFGLSRYASFHLHTEIIFTLVIFIAYTGFIRSFFDTKDKNPVFDSYLQKAMIYFISLIPLELMVIGIWDIEAGFRLFIVIKVMGFIAFLIGFLHQVRQIRSKSGKFILLGVCFLIAPAIFVMAMRHIWGSKTYEVVYNVLQVAEIGYFRVPMYTMKLGIVLELLCFIIAIGYKVRLAREEKQQNVKEIDRLGAQIQASEWTLRKQEYFNKALLGDEQTQQQSQFLVQVIEVVRSNASDARFGVEQLATSVYMSRAHLHRRLTEEAGYTPSQLILLIRLHQAANLLRTTRLTIAEVAEASGFSEPGYFTKVFKKETGYTPSEVRMGKMRSDIASEGDEIIRK